MTLDANGLVIGGEASFQSAEEPAIIYAIIIKFT